MTAAPRFDEDTVAARNVPPMRPISKVFRARQVASEMTSDGLALCGGRGDWWSQQEAAHDQAPTAHEAAAAAAPALRLCSRCPETGTDGRCALRAALDTYTGLAAGQAWMGGRPRPVERMARSTSAAQSLAR